MTVPAGKLPQRLLAELLDLGPRLPEEVLVGPAPGEDACALELPAGVLVAATDPITLTGRDVGAHAVRINANDVAVMGARPRWFLAAILLPTGCEETQIRDIFADMRQALAELGAALVGGHTEVTPVVAQPVVVGQMLGVCERDALVTSSGACAGDVVLQVGAAPVEGAGVLAAEAGARLGAVERELLERAGRALRDPGILIVDAALRAAALGASALHDPTEGGLSTGLHELADASGVALELDGDAVMWFEPGLALCRALGADPWGTLASGTLLATFPPERADAARRTLADEGFAVRALGVARAGAGVRLGDAPLPRFERDELARVLGLREI